jgi:hypothetical protein
MATCCTTLNGGITIDCSPNTGGAVRMWLANKCNVTLTKGSALDSPSTEGMIIAITMAADTYFYEFEGLRNSITLEESATINNETGSTFYAPIVRINIPRRDVAKRNKLRLLANQRMVVVVEDRNGIFWVCGVQDGMLLSELGGGLGATPTDANGYQLAFEGQEADMAYAISWATFSPVIES